MGRPKTFRLTRRGREKLEKLDRVLDQSYGAPEEELGNKQDPLEGGGLYHPKFSDRS